MYVAIRWLKDTKNIIQHPEYTFSNN